MQYGFILQQNFFIKSISKFITKLNKFYKIGIKCQEIIKSLN